MKTLDRYLAMNFFRGWLSVNLVLVGLFSFLELAKQIDDIGQGSYRLEDAIFYVALTLPGRMLELAPPSALLGSIIALGLLAKNLELLAMRAGGISIQRVGWAFAGPAVMTVFVLLLGAQFIIPSLEQTAWTRRQTALSESGTILPHGGFWTRDANRFLNLRTARSHGIQTVDIYQVDREGRLIGFIHAREAHIGAGGQWVLNDVQKRVIHEQGGANRDVAQVVLSDLMTRKQASALALPPETLSLSELYSTITSLKKRAQNPGRYRLALWQKLSLPLATVAMVMLSLPFVCRPLRGADFGWRIMVGSILGVGFFFLNQILGYAGLMFQISPVWVTLLPALALLGGGLFLTRRLI